MKKIPNYSGYLATTDGHIFSEGGLSNVNRSGRILKEWKHPQGYMYVSLKKGKKKGWHKVHRLIAMAYLPNPSNHKQINHINGKKNDNRPENLEWCNGEHNMQHAHKTGLKSGFPGEKHPTAKLKLQEVKKIVKLYQTGLYTQRQLAAQFGVSQRAVWAILNSRNWRGSL